MISATTNNRNHINFYILYSDLQETEMRYIKDVIVTQGNTYSAIFIKIDSTLFKDSPVLGRSKEAYFRLLISSVLPTNLDRCLYLDSDTTINGTISDFYASDFKNQAFVVSEDMGEILLFHKERHEVLGIPKEYKYFNSGVLLCNLYYLRKHIDLNTIFEYISKHAEKLMFLDQDVLNAQFYDKVTYSDNSFYNYMEILVNPLLPNTGVQNAKIIHFIQKPWKYTYTGKNSELWWKYAKKVYIGEYAKFAVINFFYRKCVQLTLLIIPIEKLKCFKKILLKSRK